VTFFLLLIWPVVFSCLLSFSYIGSIFKNFKYGASIFTQRYLLLNMVYRLGIFSICAANVVCFQIPYQMVVAQWAQVGQCVQNNSGLI
jgi:hypothetical protein